MVPIFDAFWTNRIAPVPAKICNFFAPSKKKNREGENVVKIRETIEKVVLATVFLTKNEIKMAISRFLPTL